MKKQKPATWSQLFSDVIRDMNIRNIQVLDEKWSKLFAVSRSVMSCKEALHWLSYQPDEKWIKVFYDKMKSLADFSFLHQKWLAEEAIRQNDLVTATASLEKMIDQAEKNSVVAWWSHILRLLPKNDPRIPKFKEQRKLTKEKNKQFTP